MSHSMTHGKTRFHYNDDYSGNAMIQTKDGVMIEIPCADLIAFVAEHVRREHIAALESADAREVLGLPRGEREENR